MPKSNALRPGWTAWPRPCEPFQLGRLGFSYKDPNSDLKADIFPVQGDRTTLTTWRAEIWRDHARTIVEVITMVDDPFDLMREVELTCNELTTQEDAA